MQIGKYRKVVRLSTVFLLLLSTSLFADSRGLKAHCRVVTGKFVHENAIVLDMGQNVSSIAFGVGTAMEEGLNFSNGLQILGGTFGFGGNITASGAGALIKVKLLKKLSTVKLKPPKFFKKLSCQFSKHADELENTPKRLTPRKLRDYLAKAKGKSRAELIQDMESVGLKLKGKSPDGKFMEFVDRHGNVRAKIHPPDKITTYDHLHIHDRNRTPLDANLKVVSPRDPAAHIEIRGTE